MRAAGLAMPESRIVTDTGAGRACGRGLRLPSSCAPAFTLGGEGGGIVPTRRTSSTRRCAAPSTPAPSDRCWSSARVLGWAEIELEVVRDRADNAVIVCSIENIDPMGVHTGDSATVAPAMTLTDVELQRLRDAAHGRDPAVGVETGGANVQFALNRATGELLVIEMNPRVSRSSALASKATGFPSPASRPGWRSATPWTSCPTRSPASPRPASSPPSTTWPSSSRASRSRSSPAPTPSSPPT